MSVGIGTTASDSPYDYAVVNINAGVDIKKVFKSFSNDKAKLYGLTGLRFTQHGGERSSLLSDVMTSGNSFRQIHLNIPIHAGLKYKINELFRGKFPNAQNLYDQLLDIDRQIEEGADAVPVVKKDVKLTKTALKKAFGKDFKNIGVVHNEEGSYLIIADGDNFKHIALEDI